jgi:phospholipid transport system substrate-binding protein
MFRGLRRLLALFFVVATAAFLAAPSAQAAADPGKLIEQLIAEISDIARTKTGADRQTAMRQVVQDKFDLASVGRAALGTYWDQASEQQRARFLAAVEASEARAYSERLGRHAGYSVTIIQVKPRAEGSWLVASRLNQQGGSPIAVEWEVHQSERGLRVGDVRVEGISLALIMRTDYSAVILANAGQVEPLVRKLEARANR